MSRISSHLAPLCMLPILLFCKCIGLPEKQYNIIEMLIFNWVNRDSDYEMDFDVEVE